MSRITRPAPTIGVLTPLAGGHYFGSVLSGVAASAGRAGGRVIAIQTLQAGLTSMESVVEPDFRMPIADAAIDAYVVVLNAAPADYLRSIQARGKPLVVISYDTPGLSAPVVGPDNAQGVRDAVAHLLEHGHTAIAFVGSMAHEDIRERRAAYEDTLRAHGLTPDPTLFYPTETNSAPAGAMAGAAMLAGGLRSTAIVAGTDYTAMGVMQAFTAAGLLLPRDQAIVGFDDLEISSYLSPPLSTATQSYEHIGSTATELVLRMLAGETVAPGRHRVDTNFVARESCGCESVLRVGRASEAPPPGGQPPALPERLMALLVTAGTSREQSAVIEEAATTVARAVTGAVAPQALAVADLDGAWETLYSAAPSEAGIAAILREIRDCGRAAHGDSRDFEDVVSECLLALTRVQMREQLAGAETLRTLLHTQYDVGLDLLRSHEEDPRALRWLAGTSARAACFGAWMSASDNDEALLDVVSTYSSMDDGDSRHAIGRTFAIPDFPPTQVTDVLGSSGDELILYVVPVNARDSDWGMLAVVGPLEINFAQGRETFNLWAGLLSVALDHEAVLHSLRQQREDLASSYERERELVAEIGASEQRYALAARAANDGLWDWNFTTGTIYYSPRWKALLGYSESAIADDPQEWFSRVHPDDLVQFEQAVQRHRDDPVTAWEHELRMRTASGAYHWMLCRGLVIAEPDGPATRMVGSLTDVTDRVELERRLRHEALYDNLTGLPNRALFLERLDRAVELAKRRPDYQFAVLFLDLDGFKVVNDSLGHLVGNELLIGIAERLTTSLRTNDTAARFGGDEFAVLLNDVKRAADVTLVVERLQAELSEPFTLEGHQVVVSAGIGIASSTTGYGAAEDVLRDADIAMYRAKSAGNGEHVVFDVGMHERAVRRLRLETELRGAIERGEFVLHYQPIVQLGTGAVTAYEALVRWENPQRGLVSPAEFLPMAEETGLIVPIGRWVLATAAAQVAEWRRAGHDLAVSVNISNRQFWHGDVVEQVREVLAKESLDPAGLRLEITEGVVMHKPGPAERMLHEIADTGVALDVDDFGTGYSSLEVLHRFPIAALKIDRSFVVRIEEDRKSGELVRAIVMMAMSLGMDVVAEGIETPTQDAYLRALGCSYGQGFLYGRPVLASLVDHAAGATLGLLAR